jgi:hypothetical protein
VALLVCVFGEVLATRSRQATLASLEFSDVFAFLDSVTCSLFMNFCGVISRSIEDFDFSSLSSYALVSVGVVGMRMDICLQLSSLLHVSDGS